ncbi:uncharacterized protein FOMMEDRAFT_81090, partial [Fomitiporia mediterranea MF3/22]|uniref:uncharacterized protein n=1 Tax=Fomitiporia mediterranea (strain MF3/22) TaxID=694068 RepID=UPI000440824E
SSDVIEDLRVYVKAENSERIFWYKERFLTETEIVENVVENASSRVCWTIHRPKRGWYLRIRSPSFPPGVSIQLSPLPSSSPFHVDAALSFSTRVNPPKRGRLLSPTSSPAAQAAPPEPQSNKSSMETVTPSPETVVHSYPPTPSPGANVGPIQPPSPETVRVKLDQLSSNDRQSTASPEVKSFLLAPHSTPRVPQPENTSLFAKALSVFKNSKPSHSMSFTLCPLPPPESSSFDTSASTSNQPASNNRQSKRHSLVRLDELIPPSPPPLVTFHDRTPAWSFGSTKGLLELDTAMEREFGVDRSFWVTVSLAYMEFLMEREVLCFHLALDIASTNFLCLIRAIWRQLEVRH